MAAEPFAPGTRIVVREVLHGLPWLEFSERVVSDDGSVLASVLTEGSPLVLDDAADVAALLERDDRWWRPRGDWTPRG
ncbi:MAG: hypothetical protein QM714_11235 [Nocardioides sp.]|uniref:hypothetical protein n=1 Tax=Nocardioides sp. TaxID=35761 RepID=UPI0039E2D044